MNKIFKLIWSVSQNAWVVCSELGKKTKAHRAKAIIVGSLQIIGITQVYAVDCGATVNGWTVSGTCDIPAQEKNITLGWNSALQIGDGNNQHVSVVNPDGSLGNLTLNANTQSRYSRYSSTGINLRNSATLQANDININIQPEAGKTVSVNGLTAWGGHKLQQIPSILIQFMPMKVILITDLMQHMAYR